MSNIKAIQSREILDSRGRPTIECRLWLDNGAYVITSVPTGTSIGKYEALELRDNDMSRMNGKGVLKAVNNINNIIAPKLIGKNPINQTEIDQLMVNLDGTNNKSKLGANSILAVSQAVLKAGAVAANMPIYYYIQQKYQLTPNLLIPNCIFGIVSGGMHGADNLDIQEFQIIPASHMDYLDSLNLATTISHKFESLLIAKGATHSTGLIGAFTPNLYNNTDVFEILIETIKTTDYVFSQDVFFGIDVAASELIKNGKYNLKDRNQAYNPKEMIEYYQNIKNKYRASLFEDPFEEDDWDSWKAITQLLGDSSDIIGDSFLHTNINKLTKAIEEKACNTILIKPNQVGTISETMQVIKTAKDAGWHVIISNRSGETNDDFISDLAVGIGADYAKFGAVNRGERIAKYNRLNQIHSDLYNENQNNSQ